MRVVYILPSILLLATVEGGYYKVRPPPPPPLPPANIHYGPHPPPHYSHHHPPPSAHAPLHSPHHSHHPYSSQYSHYPYHSRKPHIHHHAPVRDFHRSPPYPPKPSYIPWKNPNSFRAPVVKETFNSPPTAYTPSFIRDDDRGPIHTIPAPNLSLADKPSAFVDYKHYPKQDPSEAALVAVLKHGLQHVNNHHTSAYQVNEDTSSLQLNSGVQPYFAPDPDPSVPTLKIPPTTDPKSQPSNGQVPLDLYLQQQSEELQHTQQQQQQQSIDVSNANTLTAQDLFNLLNYQPNNVNLIPQSQLQQHVLQPNVQFYNQPLFLPQNYQQETFQQFSPQYHTFNYEEQTQQGAYGSDSFPSASMNLHVLQPESRNGIHDDGNQASSFDSLQIDNDVSSSDREDVYEQLQKSSSVNHQNQISMDTKGTEKKDDKSYKNKSSSQMASFFSSLSSKGTGDTIATLAGTGSYSNGASSLIDQSAEIRKESKIEEKLKKTQDENIMKPGDKVQLQKSIQIYENPYPNHDLQAPKSDVPDYNEDYSSQEDSGEYSKLTVDSEKSVDGHSNSQNNFGIRIRPKRN